MIQKLNNIFIFAEPSTQIFGGPDIFINRGSNINLTCVVEYTPTPPSFVTWKHNGKVT